MRFVWAAAGNDGPFTVRLLDAGYTEIGRLDGIGATQLRPEGELAALLAAGGDFHWTVEAGPSDALRRSRIKSFQIR